MRADTSYRGEAPAPAARVRGRRAVAAIGGCASLLLAASVAAAGASAPDGRYVGVAAGAPGEITLDVAGGTLTAFAGSTSRLACARAGHHTAGPYSFRLANRVGLRGDTFAFMVSARPPRAGAMTVSVAGRRQAGDEVTGTITARLADFAVAGNTCSASTSFETVPADRSVTEHPNRDAFGSGYRGGSVSNFAGHAGFDYADHRVTQFNGAVEILCPDRSRYGFVLDSAARGIDPIRVDGAGRFAVSGLAPLAGRGSIVQYSLSGRIDGHRATGTLRAAVAILYPRLETCSSTQPWTASAR